MNLWKLFRNTPKSELVAIIVLAPICVVVLLLDQYMPKLEPGMAELKVDQAQLKNELKLAERLQQEAEQQAADAEVERKQALAREKTAREQLMQAQSDAQAAQAHVAESLKREADAIAERARQERERRGIKSLKDASDAELEIMEKLHGVPKEQIRTTSPAGLLLIKQKQELEEKIRKLEAAASDPSKASPPVPAAEK